MIFLPAMRSPVEEADPIIAKETTEVIVPTKAMAESLSLYCIIFIPNKIKNSDTILLLVWKIPINTGSKQKGVFMM